MHFHSGWLGPVEGFGHGGYYAGDDRYGHVGHQQDRRASGQENWTAQNVKLDHQVSQETATVPGHRHKREAPKDGSSAGQSGGSQETTGPRSDTSVDDKTKSGMEKGLEEVAVEQNKGPEAKTETRTEARTS
jgi:hypothetical protein